MMLPDGFVFSQSSLQDYSDCQRRFQLRHVQRCRWPAPETADALAFEQCTQQGYAFHRLMRRLHSRLSPETLTGMVASDPVLTRWWENYWSAPPANLPSGFTVAELTLATTLCGCRLEVRYDLVTGQPGGPWVIVDWKTSSHRSPRSWWAERLQTHTYPFVLVQAGAALNGGQQIAAEHVEMLYWFPEFPSQPERFTYNEEALESDRLLLERMVRDIEERAEDAFSRTENRKLCRYCVYRSLCWDDVLAGVIAEVVDSDQSESILDEFDLEAIAPIPY